MDTYTKEQVLQKISDREPLDGLLDDGTLYIKIVDYVPYISTAIHHGHRFRESLESICLFDENERYHEEDPYTGDMISDCPIVLIAQDSRYEYDLNRRPEECILLDAWGKKVWKTEMSKLEKEESLNKHKQFYDIVYSLIDSLSAIHPQLMIFDIHSYNILDRNYSNPPMFNIGTHFIDSGKFGLIVNKWIEELRKIEIPGTEVVVQENGVYYGKGYLAESVQSRYKNCLVLPTEVKKIYADELKPEPYTDKIDAIHVGFVRAMKNCLDSFLNGQS